MESLVAEIKQSRQKVFVYGMGTAGKWLSANLGQKIDGFIDADVKKTPKAFDGIPVYSPLEARKLLTSESIIIVTALDIQDVIYQLEQCYVLERKLAF